MQLLAVNFEFRLASFPCARSRCSHLHIHFSRPQSICTRNSFALIELQGRTIDSVSQHVSSLLTSLTEIDDRLDDEVVKKHRCMYSSRRRNRQHVCFFLYLSPFSFLMRDSCDQKHFGDIYFAGDRCDLSVNRCCFSGICC